jgi:hypothetical protein
MVLIAKNTRALTGAQAGEAVATVASGEVAEMQS